MLYLVRHAAPMSIAGKFSLYDRQPTTLAYGDEVFAVGPETLYNILLNDERVRYTQNEIPPTDLRDHAA